MNANNSLIVAPSRRGAILIVDDEAQNRELLRRLLIREGHRVDTAATGEEALSAIHRRRPDLILLDVQMPGISGFEVCRELKSRVETRLIPIILVTALSSRDDRIRGIDAGADDFVSKPVDREELQARVASLLRVKHYTDQLDSAEAILLSLAKMVEARDAYTRDHCDRLAYYATALGECMGVSDRELGALHRGAILHDIGKIGIPDAILLKPSALTDAEYALMKQHTVIGDKLCGALQSLELVRPIVRHHHERLDGTGYPDGLRGAEVPFLAQIVGIADTYDAITTDRPYRPGRPADVAYAELRHDVSRGWQDARLVEAFIALGQCGALTLAAAASA